MVQLQTFNESFPEIGKEDNLGSAYYTPSRNKKK